MSLKIEDITAAAERMRIDASGNINLGSGSPPGRFSVLGVEMAAVDGEVVNQRIDSAAVDPVEGSVLVNPQDFAEITTGVSRKPIVTIDGMQRAETLTGSSPACTSNFADSPAAYLSAIFGGGFWIRNQNTCEEAGCIDECPEQLALTVPYVYI